jgi:hypothetical protein
MPPLINLSGKRFERLLVLERSSIDTKDGHAMWKCQCDCGAIRYMLSNNLRNNTSCGCFRSEVLSSLKTVDITGQRFGRLIVLGRADKKGSHVMWYCQCDCRKETIIAGDRLRTGKTKSCGCLLNESRHTAIHGKNLLGQRFGRLYVVSEDKRKTNNQRRWNCQCTCGRIVSVLSQNLRRGTTKSCGCIKTGRHSTPRSKLNRTRREINKCLHNLPMDLNKLNMLTNQLNDGLKQFVQGVEHAPQMT